MTNLEKIKKETIQKTFQYLKEKKMLKENIDDLDTGSLYDLHSSLTSAVSTLQGLAQTDVKFKNWYKTVNSMLKELRTEFDWL